MDNLNLEEKQLIYILACAVNNIIPDKKRLEYVDLEELFKIGQRHEITAIIETVLKKVELSNDKFSQVKQKTIRNQIYYELERNKILNEFEKNQIWYMPLKGIILKDFYPEIGMREMADNDILFDSAKQELVKNIMKELKYQYISIGKDNHDVYHKQNILSFELHRSLFYEKDYKDFYNYYKNIKEKLIMDNTKKYCFHFTYEDFYIYMLVHEYKHSMYLGTGLRGLLDAYVFLKQKEETLNWKYIFEELNKLNLLEFEKGRRNIVKKIFDVKFNYRLNEDELNLFRYYKNSAICLNSRDLCQKRLNIYFNERKKHSKIKYIFSRLFPSYEIMKEWYPIICKHKFLIPFIYVWRLIKSVCVKKKKIVMEFYEVRKYDKANI